MLVQGAPYSRAWLNSSPKRRLGRLVAVGKIFSHLPHLPAPWHAIAAMTPITSDRLFIDALRDPEFAPPRTLLRDIHVLVVDDDEDSVEIFATTLEAFGANVIRSRTAKNAFAVIKATRVNVLVSDLMMPGQDGLWLIEQIRQLQADRGGNVPAVALTAHYSRYDANSAFGEGFNLYLPKPLHLFAFVRAIARLAGR